MTARKRNFLRVFLLLVVPCLAIVGGGYYYLLGGRFVETDNAFVKARTLSVSAEISGTVQTVFVHENETVIVGQPLFKLNADERRIAVAQATAALAQVRTDLNSLRAEYREKQAEIELAQTRYRFALTVKKRQADLVAKSFASASRFDDAQYEVNVSHQQIATLKQSLASIAERLGGSLEAPVESHPAYLSAQATLDQAELHVRRSTVRATLPGVVSKLPDPGQYLTAGRQAMSLVSNDEYWIEANFTETDLTRMQPGQQAHITIDTYPDANWTGVVESLSPATGAEFSIIPAQNATGNWVKIPQRVAVRIKLTDMENMPALRIGLSALVEVDTEHQRSLFGHTL